MYTTDSAVYVIRETRAQLVIYALKHDGAVYFIPELLLLLPLYYTIVLCIYNYSNTNDVTDISMLIFNFESESLRMSMCVFFLS